MNRGVNLTFPPPKMALSKDVPARSSFTATTFFVFLFFQEKITGTQKIKLSSVNI